MKSLVITETISEITEDCIKRAFSNNVVITKITELSEVRDILDKENPKRKVYFYGSNCHSIMTLIPFEALYSNFKVIKGSCLILSKVQQMKFLEDKIPEILLPHTYLDESKVLEPGIEDTKIDCTSDMVVVDKIDVVKTWVCLGYATNGSIVSKVVGNFEGDYADPNAKFVPISRASDESRKFEYIVKKIITEFELSGVFELVMIEDKNDDLWYYETRIRPTEHIADFFERGLINFIKRNI